MDSTLARKMFGHLQIPLEDVLKATDNFADENIISVGDFGPVYKGRLLRSGNLIKIAAKRFDPKFRYGYVHFWNEVSMFSDLDHENIVSIIGFCDEEGEKIIITPSMANGSLQGDLDNPDLTWKQRLKISIGVARALGYLRHDDEGRSYGVIHGNINSSTILLDENWEPKLSGFGMSIKQSGNRADHVILSKPIRTLGYMDPEIEKTKGVTHKSDIYAFGVVLFEILCGRKAFIEKEKEANRVLAELAKYHYENKTLEDIIHPSLLNQIYLQPLVRYSEVAYSCLKEDQTHQPDVNDIISVLERTLELELGLEKLEKKDLQHLNIPLDDILLASDNFSEAYKSSFDVGIVWYIVERCHFGKVKPSSEEREILTSIDNNVLIKRFLPTYEKQAEFFFTEIEILTSINHCNIVTPIGFCVESSEMVIVFENPSNGYLRDYLIGRREISILTWEKRLNICIDVAHALNYLHYEMEYKKVIIHTNICSWKFELDENWGAKIDDYQTAVFRPSNQEDEAIYQNKVVGAKYYRDPEHEKTGMLTRKSDVYSFGVVLFEILCGKLADDPIYLESHKGGLAPLARQNFGTEELENMIDIIIKDETNKDSLHSFIEIAYQCVTETQDQRPTMKVVVKELAKALLFQEMQVQQQDKNSVVDELQKANHKISLNLLDDNWEAKLCSFEFSIKQPVDRAYQGILCGPSGTFGYIELEIEGTYQSDIYAFGVVLFEILCGREAFMENEANRFLAPVARCHYKNKPLKDIINPDMWIQMDPQSLEKYSKLAFSCLKEDPTYRPDIDYIVTKLEKTWKLQISSAMVDASIQTSRQVSSFSYFAKSNTRTMESILTSKFAHLKIPLEDVIKATNNFADENIISVGDFGPAYKGRLLRSGKLINIAAKRSDRAYGLGDAQFWNEVSMLCDLKHKNIISIIGFCDEKNEKIIITPSMMHGSLHGDLYSPNLTWTQRLKISVDVARALNYLRYDEGHNYGVIHRNINSSTILLDENREAKLSGFEISFKQHVNLMDQVLRTEPISKVGYLDPEIRKTGGATHKSDIYSFGVVLFELLCGREAYVENEANRFLVPLVRCHYENKTLHDVIYPDLRSKKLSPQSLLKYSDIAYSCISDEGSQRPNINSIVNTLEKALKSQMRYENNIDELLHHLEIPLEKVVSATNNFADENLIKEGIFGKDYKGQMLESGQSIDIYARRLKHKYGQGDIEFFTEISMLSSFKHKNIASLVGFCDENDEKIIIYEHVAHGSLDQHLSDPNLTWFQRLQICLGVSRGLSYIHYDVIHCDINNSKIFLDKDWEPKIFGFEFSTKYPGQSLRHRLLLSSRFNYTNMTTKYDVFSFGILLFEVVCGRKPMITNGGVEEELEKSIDPNLRKQIDKHSLDAFTKIAYACLNQQLVQRPTMDQIVKELEDVYELQCKHENLEQSTAAHEAASSKFLKMGWLEIPLSEISQATNNFDETCCIGEGGFGKVYKATIEVLDIQNLVLVEDKCKDELPKKSKTVAIKRISHTQGKEGFLTEIKLLTSCKHQNIVSLFGYSSQDHELILVYEYVVEGSLGDYFRDTSKMIKLTWAQRIQICLGIARGINYLHTNMEGKPRIIHRDIKSDNILLDGNLNAKVADFGLSKLHPIAKQARSTIYTENTAGTDVYMDPEYQTTNRYKKESDVYSFGVVLFEILSGRPAYDLIYTRRYSKGLAPIARRRFNDGTLKELIDPNMIEEEDNNFLTLNKGPGQESFSAFSGIAYKCLAETQVKRPTMETVIKELQNALKLQGETMVLPRFRLCNISSATEEFSEIYFIGLHEYGEVYKAEIGDFENKISLTVKERNEPKSGITNVAIKRISRGAYVKQRFFSEIEMRTSYKHPNIVSLLGFCDEGDESILVYEHASNKSLDDHLKILKNVDNTDTLTWTQRLHMCLGIALGLNHLHTKMDSQETTVHVHGDIRSANILLGKNLEPKIAYFGIFGFRLPNQEAKVYWDPEFQRTRVMRKEYDIFSFGVILLEIFCGRLAYDPIYIAENDKGLAPIARSHFNDGTIKKLLDPNIEKVSDNDIITSNRGPNQDSLATFLKIANQCLEEAPSMRPTMELVIKELEMALNFQENLMKNLQLSLKDIELATDDFSQKNCFVSGRFGDAYKGEMSNTNVNTSIVVKRWGSKFDDQFWIELDILSKRKHKNIIGLEGYCNEMNEKIIVYEHMSKGSLNRYLKDFNLRWLKRLAICIDVASALEFLHGGDVTLKKVVHRNLKSHGILLNDHWNAKISNFELSSLDSLQQDMEHISHDAYLDPDYKRGFLTEKSDIYSLGVVLFEILCGGSAWVDGHEDKTESLGYVAKQYYSQGQLNELVFEGIKKQIVRQSLTTFGDIAYMCLHEDGNKRPEASEVVIQLKKALKFQEDTEIWEPKLPTDYKEIMLLSKTPEIYEKKDIFDKLSDGILVRKEKVWFKLSDNGKANKMISATATEFSYKNHESHKFRSIHVSRFGKVAKMLDVSNLKTHLSIDNKFLSLDCMYGVYLVFRFCDPRISLRKLMYINLKYTSGTETLHSYFGTQRDEDWMMIELYRFLNPKEVVSFTFLLESLSRYYCTSDAIYIEGIEFQAIKKVEHQDDKKLKEVQQVQKSNSDLDHMHQLPTINEKLILRELDGMKQLMVSAMEVLYNSPKMTLFHFKSSPDSRFQNVAELLPRQVIKIKYKIEIQMLSLFTEYTCYLVFKVSEKCRGLHCPVKVRDLLYRRNKENKIIYFRSPAPLNQHDTFWIPQQREDGWMEVMIWKFNSKYNKLGKNHVPMNLKFITYEGTMSGLIICGLEFRPT